MSRYGQFGGSLIFATILGLATIAPVSGQSTPVIDGVANAGEYSVEHADGPVHLYASVDADTLYLAIVGEEEGWVSVGVGSSHMDGAIIFMGYVGNGKEAFTVQKGVDHFHYKYETTGVRAHAMTRSGNSMTMELALDRSAFPGADGTSLDVIYAVGHYDSFVIYHNFRGTARLELR